MNRHLYRSRDDRMLAGVAGGLADLWDADPSLVRIVWALLVPLTGGVALVVYIVMAIIVPEEDGTSFAGQALAWNDEQRTARSAGASADAESAAGASGTPAASGGSASPAAGGWPQSRAEARDARRTARWEARAARREARGRIGRTGAMIIGVLLILIGSWYLVREFLPSIDFDWFWPVVLVAVGIVVLVLAIRPRSDDAGGVSHDHTSDGG